MYPFLEELAEKADVAISPTRMLVCLIRFRQRFRSGAAGYGPISRRFARAGLINIAGGCCGNTPEHIAAIAKALERPILHEDSRAAQPGEFYDARS